MTSSSTKLTHSDLHHAKAGKPRMSRTLSTSSPISPRSIDAAEFPPSLIIDGARALTAFCRPYPIATVGVPSRMDFDIKSSSFKLEVKVASEDAAGAGKGTEIYLPFVHYARTLDPKKKTYTESSFTSGTGVTTNGSRTSLLRSQHQAQDALGSIATDNGNGNGSGAATPSRSAPMELDIEVRASTGRWELSGQTMRWYYDVPTRGTSTYTLEIRRKGGSLPREMGTAQSGGWSDVCGDCVIA
jgi:hypothetical protein